MTEPLQPQISTSLPVWSSGRRNVRCVRIDRETHDVATFVFRPVDPALIAFKPGQFVTLDLHIDGDAVTRCYSLFSAPSRPWSFSITVKRVPGGRVSNWLHDHLAEGDELSILGPQGDFNLVDRPAERILMLSGGSGITPVMSMTRWLHDIGADVDVHFVHCARTPDDIIYRDELEAIFGVNRRLQLSLVCESAGDANGSGYRGRLDEHMLGQMVPDLHERTVFTCGPEPYMAAVRDILGGLAFPAAQYHEESFGGAPTVPAAEPGDDPLTPSDEPVEPGGDVAVAEAATGYAVRMVHSGLEFTCEASETLLQAVQRNGGWIPCACQMGVCGTCKVATTSGAVTMDHMGGLSDADEQAGYVLACCAYPRGPVELDC